MLPKFLGERENKNKEQKQEKQQTKGDREWRRGKFEAESLTDNQALNEWSINESVLGQSVSMWLTEKLTEK